MIAYQRPVGMEVNALIVITRIPAAAWPAMSASTVRSVSYALLGACESFTELSELIPDLALRNLIHATRNVMNIAQHLTDVQVATFILERHKPILFVS